MCLTFWSITFTKNYEIKGTKININVSNLYYDKNAIIDLTSEDLDLSFYNGSNIDFTINTNFIQQTVSNKTIYDTRYYEQKLGVKISIYDSNNNLLTSSSLMGIYFEYNGLKYYPRYDGTTRINIAPKIANVSSKIKMHGEKSNLTGGKYKIIIESFGSADGIYYGEVSSDTTTLDVNVLDTVYGLSMSMGDYMVMVDKDTGNNLNSNKDLRFNLKYSSGLENPELRISLYRRDYTNVYSIDYELVDLSEYVTNLLTATNREKEYVVSDKPASVSDNYLLFKENLITGTYKLVFKLYDGDNLIGETYEYFIIK